MSCEYCGEDWELCDECDGCLYCGDCFCDEDEYEDDLDTAPPSKAYPRVDIDPDTLPF